MSCNKSSNEVTSGILFQVFLLINEINIRSNLLNEIIACTVRINPFIAVFMINYAKCGSGAKCKRSVGPLMREMKMYYLESRSRGNPTRNK
jgi:hypothetical protein